MQGRPSHSVAFAVGLFLMVFWLAWKGILGRQMEPLLLGSVAVASVVAHLAWDAMDGGATFPLWMSFSSQTVYVSPLGGVLLEAAAAVLLWAIATLECSRRQTCRQKAEGIPVAENGFQNRLSPIPPHPPGRLPEKWRFPAGFYS